MSEAATQARGSGKGMRPGDGLPRVARWRIRTPPDSFGAVEKRLLFTKLVEEAPPDFAAFASLAGLDTTCETSWDEADADVRFSRISACGPGSRFLGSNLPRSRKQTVQAESGGRPGHGVHIKPGFNMTDVQMKLDLGEGRPSTLSSNASEPRVGTSPRRGAGSSSCSCASLFNSPRFESR